MMWTFVAMHVCHQRSLIRCFRKFSRSLLQRIQGSGNTQKICYVTSTSSTSALWLAATLQQVHNKSNPNSIASICCGFVVDSDLFCNKSTTSWHVEMLWICYRRSICRGFVVKLVVRQIHNKSNKWSLGISVVKCLHAHLDAFVVWYLRVSLLTASQSKRYRSCIFHSFSAPPPQHCRVTQVRRYGVMGHQTTILKSFKLNDISSLFAVFPHIKS